MIGSHKENIVFFEAVENPRLKRSADENGPRPDKLGAVAAVSYVISVNTPSNTS